MELGCAVGVEAAVGSMAGSGVAVRVAVAEAVAVGGTGVGVSEGAEVGEDAAVVNVADG